jgi:VWFA-related protein
VQRSLKLLLVIAISMLSALSAARAQTPSKTTSKPKLPKQIDLDKNLDLIRDPATGELSARPKAGSELGASSQRGAAAGGVIRTATRVLLAPCSAANSDGIPLAGLHEQDFRAAIDGSFSTVNYLDVSTQPANIALVLDSSPSEAHALEDSKAAARALAASLAPQDRAAVVAFAGHAHLLLPLSTDRSLLESALNRIAVMRSAMETGSNIYSAVFLTAHQLFGGPAAPREGRNAIVLLTDGQDSGLDLSWNPASMRPVSGSNVLSFEDVARELAADNIQLFVVSTENRPKGMTPAWLAAHTNATLISAESRRLQIPAYTIFLAELVRQVGGSLYFLRETGTLAEIYRRIAITLRAEYVLGINMAVEMYQPGWHRIAVDFRDPASHPEARLDCRRSYYVPNSTNAGSSTP